MHDTIIQFDWELCMCVMGIVECILYVCKNPSGIHGSFGILKLKGVRGHYECTEQLILLVSRVRRD